MAFSQSFDFGDSTMMQLENDLKSTNAKKHIKPRESKYVHNQQKNSNASCDNYSEFFKDSFPYVEQLSKTTTPNKNRSMMRVSQIEAALNSPASESCGSPSVFEAQICTEDVFGTDGESHPDSKTKEKLQLDESSFLCPALDEQASQQLQEDLKRSRCVLVNQDVEYRRVSNTSPRLSQNLSKMSPNQLRVSPTSSTGSNVSDANEVVVDVESLRSISAWNLPHSVLSEYKKKGVVKMFDWQVECLSKPQVLFEYRNLVYSAPTSAGKTLVSEILLLKTVLERNKKVLVILPFISVVREKMLYLQDLLTPSGYRVEGFFGGYTPPGGFDALNVAICTIEKANSIVNKLLEQGKLDVIGTVVVDEIHLISDPGRGYILELLLAKILYMSRKHALQIQVITMSATLANVELLQSWLNAELYITNYRPVALQEMIKVGTQIYDNNLRVLRDIKETSAVPMLGNDCDHVAQLCIETLLEGCSVIVFCPSKDWCENLAVQLATAMHTLIKSGSEVGQKLRTHLNPAAIEDVKQQLRDIPTGLDAVMSKAITYACAFHHAGLTTEERDIVEASFKGGALKVLVATSTLSSGVNLPARRVLIRSPLFGGKQMSSLTYRQMIGRAGRTGRDTLGESILICNESNARVGKDLVTAQLKPITSCLEMDGSTHLKRALLEVISSGVASTKDNINDFVNCTLLSAQKKMLGPPTTTEKDDEEGEGEKWTDYISDALDFLMEYEFIRLQTDEEAETSNFVATRLGAACLASSMPPTDGLILFAELQKSRRCFVLESELHAVYLVTPYSVCYQLQDLDWLLYLDMWEKLNPAMKKVGELIGVKEAFLVRAMRGQAKLDYKQIQIHKRFYTALALQELVNETPINVVAHKFKCQRGMLQGLQQMASTFAGIVTAFCNSLQWSTLALVVSQFKDRLFFGIHRDLIDLMRLPNLTHKRARAIHDAGFTNLVELASADVLLLEKALFNSHCFDTAKQLENENAQEAAKRNMARNVFITGHPGMSVAEAAKLLIQDARQFVQYEIGVGNIKWTQTEEGTTTTDLHMSVEDTHHNKVNHSIPKRKMSEGLDSSSNGPSPFKIPKLDKVVDKAKENYSTSIAKDSVRTPTGIKSSKTSGSTKQFFALKTQNPPLRGTESSLPQTPNSVPKSGFKPSPINAHSACDLGIKSARCSTKKPAVSADDPKRKTAVPKQSTDTTIPTVTNEASRPGTQNPTIQTNSPKPVTSAFVKESQKPAALSSVTGNTKDRPTLSTTENPVIPNPTNSRNFDMEQPSTSSAASKELLRREIAERRRLALLKINKKRAEMENVGQRVHVDTPNEIQVSTNISSVINTNKLESQVGRSKVLNSQKETRMMPEVSPIITPKNTVQVSTNISSVISTNKLESQVGHSKVLNSRKETRMMPEVSPIITPKNTVQVSTNTSSAISTNKVKTQVGCSKVLNAHTPPSSFLRRSPRNQQPPKSKVPAEEDLFMVDDSFMLSSAVTAAITAAESKFTLPTANSETDEIPSSQPKEMSELGNANGQTPYASRIMRSYQLRSQRLQSPQPSPKVCETETVSTESVGSSMELSEMSSSESSLIKNPLQLNASHILSASKDDDVPSSFNSIDIVDICGSRRLFQAAIQMLHEAPRCGLSVGLQMQAGKRKPLIGANLLINQVAAQQEAAATSDVLFEVDDNTFLACLSFCLADNVVYYMNMQQEGKKEAVGTQLKVEQLIKLLTRPELTLIMHEGKEQLKILRHAMPQLSRIAIKLEDPKVANWLLQPDKVLSFHNMCQQFAPECKGLADLCGSGRGYSSYGLDASNAILPKIRASVEACVSMHILHGQIENLERIGTGQLLKFFRDLEMPIQLSLCNMEFTGFPAKQESLQRLSQQMLSTMKKLEAKIYELHGSRFNLGSSQAVAKVLGLHRKASGKVSTSRQILEKLDSPISQLIVSYRKLSTVLAKNVQPLLKCCQDNRVYGQSLSYTATGRISMSEPNLQNVAKDFDINLDSEKVNISCRSAFMPMDSKRCLISADFCQLEMRILAHLSQDPALLDVMNSPQDLFTAIAARWNHMHESEVSETLRNGTKQICYGIVYGMGMRSLAESLKCTEHEAQTVSEQFHQTYAGIAAYIQKVVKFARNNGYVETITGRRRYLEHINSGELQMKNQAERQAINSTIQGSAADIAKSAILRMEKHLLRYRERLGIAEKSVNLVLHLHDELIFEVPEDKAKKIAKVLSLTMESCVKLSVPLKVKLKIGRSWGALKEVGV
ncbi:DNA polymerase theta [Drosophila tropicalis]|uniref:DNA polymerase theta n=1 Tax=Drosophila tropicalis TaxID=46794 RepID=UPI0035AC0379